MGRRAFGPKKKKACDLKNCRKEKIQPKFRVEINSGLKHPRAFETQAAV